MLQLWISQPVQSDSIELSPEGMSLAEHDVANANTLNAVFDVEEMEDELDQYLSDEDRLKIRLLEELISWFTGKPFKFDFVGLKKQDKASKHAVHKNKPIKSVKNTGPPGGTQQTQKQPQPNWGLRFHHSETKSESEKMNFKASGVVKSSDGREVEFDLNLHMSREKYEYKSIDISASQALIDPIVIQTDHIPPGLSDKKIQFDLDLDGTLDEMSVPRAGSGFLVFDRNENGKIDDGSELFGPSTGHGFSELKTLDSDGNGWLDENDLTFENLQIWSMNETGEMELTGLIEADVGAIYLSSVSTEFQLSDSSFEQNGQLKESSIYMKESGGVSSIHEVDILV